MPRHKRGSRNSSYDWPLSAPDPAAYFPGDVVVLIDPSCGSSCEFFTAMLQSSGRATVVGQYASNGAGGSIKHAALPGGLSFQYPYTGVVFDGTNDLVLEAKGVEPDVRVPVTLESEAARIAGEDPVLAAGLDDAEETCRRAAGRDQAGSCDRCEGNLHHRQP